MKSEAIKLNNSMDGICYFRPGVQRPSRRGIKGGREGGEEAPNQRESTCNFAKEGKKKKRNDLTIFRNHISSRPLLPRTLPPFRFQRVTRYLARQTPSQCRSARAAATRASRGDSAILIPKRGKGSYLSIAM